MAHRVSKSEDNVICGGRHQILLKSWTNILKSFKATGAKLVFFSDLNFPEHKKKEFMIRSDFDFQIYTEIYDKIMAGKPVREIIDEQTDRKALTSTFYEMAVIAHDFGEFIHSTQYECDLEAAQYAQNNNAIAVITNDTDFLIFNGPWRFWSTYDFKITPLKQITTVEYSRDGMANVLSLAPRQMPLFATLIGNDIIKPYYDQLVRFASKLGPLKFKFQYIARYVRDRFEDSHGLSDADIIRIVRQVFGSTDMEIVDLMKQSLNSYRLDFAPAIVINPLEKQLLHTKMYRAYISNMRSIWRLTLNFYDLRGCNPDKCLPLLLIDWLKRRKGVLHCKNKTDGRKRASTLTIWKRMRCQFILHVSLNCVERIFFSVGE